MLLLTPRISIAVATKVKGEGIFECYHFGQNGPGVSCLWRITDQVFAAKRLFLTSTGFVKVFRRKFKAELSGLVLLATVEVW